MKSNPVLFFKDLLNSYTDKKILVVTGKYFLKNNPIGQEYLNVLIDHPTLSYYTNVKPNPKWDDIKSCYALLDNKQYDVIISIGGGSTIDWAKIIFFLQSLNKEITEIDPFEISKQIPSSGDSQLLAIPTTFGTGSEVTQFATFYVDQKKVSLDSPYIIPSETIIDSRFLKQAPTHLIARTAMDAASHAIESLWSVHSTQQSIGFAKEGLELIWNNLEKAITEDAEAQERLAIGAHLAGQAIQITRTTACHSISYPLTSFFGVDHGQATIITIPELLRFNSSVSAADCLDERGVDFVNTSLRTIVTTIGCNNINEAAMAISNFTRRINLKTRLSELGLKREDLDLVAKHAFTPSRMKNNPRQVLAENVDQFLKSIF